MSTSVQQREFSELSFGGFVIGAFSQLSVSKIAKPLFFATDFQPRSIQVPAFVKRDPSQSSTLIGRDPINTIVGTGSETKIIPAVVSPIPIAMIDFVWFF